jgi:hypothetical protein
VAFSPAGNNVAITHGSTPFVTAYPFTTAFGTKYANPASLPAGGGNGVAFSRSGSSIAIGHVNSPYISAYPFSNSGFGTKYANPASLPAFDGRGVDFA